MEKQIKTKCEEYDINPEVLTPSEIEALKKEIIMDQKGIAYTDSVLDDPDIRKRTYLANLSR